MRTGVYPGSFNPPTVAHLAVAAAGRRAGHLDRVDLTVSEAPLGKGEVTVPTLDDRVEVLRLVAATRPWLGVRRTRHRLLADIAEGYDVLIVGADKWAQVLDPYWYGGSEALRDRCVARLPAVLVVPRPPHPPPQVTVEAEWSLVEVGDEHAAVSSSGVREGRHEWMAPEAAEWDRRTGGWSDPDRYRRRGPYHPGW